VQPVSRNPSRRIGQLTPTQSPPLAARARGVAGAAAHGGAPARGRVWRSGARRSAGAGAGRGGAAAWGARGGGGAWRSAGAPPGTYLREGARGGAGAVAEWGAAERRRGARVAARVHSISPPPRDARGGAGAGRGGGAGAGRGGAWRSAGAPPGTYLREGGGGWRGRGGGAGRGGAPVRGARGGAGAGCTQFPHRRGARVAARVRGALNFPTASASYLALFYIHLTMLVHAGRSSMNGLHRARGGRRTNDGGSLLHPVPGPSSSGTAASAACSVHPPARRKTNCPPPPLLPGFSLSLFVCALMYRNL
jgi:hypothetical protein